LDQYEDLWIAEKPTDHKRPKSERIDISKNEDGDNEDRYAELAVVL
jgi:hypothetical protein